MSFTPLHLFYDDVAIGQVWESQGRTITEADVVNFAGLTGDFNPMHMDEAYSATTPYGKRMAHGLLILTIGSGLALWAPPMRTLALFALRDWQFKEPVYPGETIRVRTTLTEREEKGRGRRALCTWRREILKGPATVVQEGTTQTLVLGRAGAKET